MKELNVENGLSMSPDRKSDPRIQSAVNSTKSPEQEKIDNPEVYYIFISSGRGVSSRGA